jgi:hypothetical protein
MKSHPKCGQPTEYAVPVRLIDVSGKTPFLVQGIPNTPYAILSHCWGHYKPFTTTTQNIDAHERSIDFVVLPKTFQDAIELTREFNIQYLWIDSLCIIQDSDSDKGHQCTRMGDYYRNAMITFSALNSRDSTEGFLNPRPTVTSVPLFEKPGYTNCHVRPRLRSRAEIFKEAALSGRGWTLQERLLSTRVLHYGTTEMFWECLTCTTREGSSIEHRDQEGVRDLVTAEGEDFKRIAFSADVDILDPDFGAFAVWYRLIRQFSLRSLTYADDRIPAVAGLATTMASNTGCHYMAGVWKEDLEGLLWRVEPAKDTTHSIIHPTLFSADHGARVPLMPTWSWASVAGPITYLPAREKRCHNELAASVVRVDLGVDALRPYGKVTGGSITLLAVCRKVACFKNLVWGRKFKHGDIALRWIDAGDDSDLSCEGLPAAAGFDEYSMYEQTVRRPAHLPHPYHIRVDVSMLPESAKRFMAIMIAERETTSMVVYNRSDAVSEEETRRTYFLIVEEDKIRHGQWKRVGMGWSTAWDFENRERQEIVLV